MNNLIEIRLHGRGGQGTVTAAELIAMAAFYNDKEVQAFPSFGVERRGAPVKAFVRISEEPIRLREQIYDPDYIIVQDSSLIETDASVLQGATKDVIFLINSEKEVWPDIKAKQIVTVPATKIALDKIGKPFFNTALVGAFAALSRLISEQAVEKAIRKRFANKPELVESNVKAMKQAFLLVKN